MACSHLYVLHRPSPHLRLPPFTDGGKAVVLRGVYVRLVAHTHLPLVEVMVPGGIRGGRRRVIPLLGRISILHVRHTAHSTKYTILLNTHTQHAYTSRIRRSRSQHRFLLSLLSSSSLLNVLRRLDLRPRRIVPRVRTRIYVDHLSVSFVFKEEPGLVIGDHLERCFLNGI